MGMYKLADGSWWFSGSVQMPQGRNEPFMPVAHLSDDQMVTVEGGKQMTWGEAKNRHKSTSGFTPKHLEFTND